MKRSTVLTEKNRGTWATIFLVLILIPLALSIVGIGESGGVEATEVFLEAPDARWESCFREVEYMRFKHMDFLKDVREDVVRHGLKGGVTLAGCQDCHRNRELFCDRCHDAASVNLDCWGCHFYPETAAEAERLGQ